MTERLQRQAFEQGVLPDLIAEQQVIASFFKGTDPSLDTQTRLQIAEENAQEKYFGNVVEVPGMELVGYKNARDARRWLLYREAYISVLEIDYAEKDLLQPVENPWAQGLGPQYVSFQDKLDTHRYEQQRFEELLEDGNDVVYAYLGKLEYERAKAMIDKLPQPDPFKTESTIAADMLCHVIDTALSQLMPSDDECKTVEIVDEFDGEQNIYTVELQDKHGLRSYKITSHNGLRDGNNQPLLGHYKISQTPSLTLAKLQTNVGAFEVETLELLGLASVIAAKITEK